MIHASNFSTEALLAELLDWVRIESPTYDPAAVNRMVDFIAPRIGALGFSIERLGGRDGYGDILRCRRPGDGPGILMIAHADTVHPVGTLASKLLIRREGDKCFGPAIYDMKGGTVIALAAMKAVIDANKLNLPVTFIINPDEEIGSPTSRELIEAEAKRHRYVLIPEPAKASGVRSRRDATPSNAFSSLRTDAPRTPAGPTGMVARPCASWLRSWRSSRAAPILTMDLRMR